MSRVKSIKSRSENIPEKTNRLLKHHFRKASSKGSPEEQALSRPYVRAKDLPPLIPLWPAELDDYTKEGTAYILAKINQYLRAERRRSIKSHWSYNLTKHVALVVAYHHEMQRLKTTPSTS